MENASKALIIAGAILLAIVIISLGLIVVNNTRGTVDKSNLSEQEIQSFNAKFTAYEGDKVSGSRVNSLIQQVIATNQSSYNEGKVDNLVSIGFPSASNPSGRIWIGMDTSGNMKERTGSVDSTTVSVTNFSSGSGAKDPTSMLSVNTGKTYTVEITAYNNGLVQSILVKLNT